VSAEEGPQIMTAYRTPERIETGRCHMCERDRQIVFDLTAASRGHFEVMSVCDECAPRASKLMGWIGRVLSGAI
jgi:hypothetical protein